MYWGNETCNRNRLVETPATCAKQHSSYLRCPRKRGGSSEIALWVTSEADAALFVRVVLKELSRWLKRGPGRKSSNKVLHGIAEQKYRSWSRTAKETSKYNEDLPALWSFDNRASAHIRPVVPHQITKVKGTLKQRHLPNNGYLSRLRVQLY